MSFWLINTCENEDWSHFFDTRYKTKEEAEACVVDFCDEWGVDHCFIGEAYHPEVNPCAKLLIDQMLEQMYSVAGDWVESWVLTILPHQIDQLSDSLKACWQKWLEDTGNKPTFFLIRNVEMYEV